jgi:putative copper resistance protein D
MTVHTLYIFSVWLHILAATAWIGGMFFLVLVVVPWLRHGDRELGVKFLRDTGIRFRSVGWACFAILVVTGTFNLWARGVRLHDFASAAWRGSAFGKAVIAKLGTFALVLAISAVHDFAIGPRATAALEADPESPHARRLRKQASWLGRLNALLAVALVLLAVILVRGWPW